MPATMTTVSSLLKEVYEKQLREQLNNDVVTLRRVEKTSEGVTSEVGGRYVTFPIHTKRNAGIGARNELEALPTAGQQGYNAARVALKYLYGLVRLSGQTFELANENFQAFASALDLELSGLKNDLAKDLNRQVYGAGTGVVATANAPGTGSIGANPFNVASYSAVKWAQLGMVVDVYASDLTTLKASARTITAINTTSGQITYDGASQNTVSTDVLVRTGSINREITGFASIVNTGNTLYNIVPGAEPTWQANVNANGGTNRALSEGLMIQMVDQCRINGDTPTVIFSNLGVRRAYFNLLTQQRRYTNTMEFEGGFKGLAFTTDKGDIPLVVDVDCPDNTLYFINEPNLKVYRSQDWSFMDRDGSRWQRVVGYDAYEAVMYTYMELGAHRRNVHAKLADITEG